MKTNLFEKADLETPKTQPNTNKLLRINKTRHVNKIRPIRLDTKTIPLTVQPEVLLDILKEQKYFE